jgi:hypothetical protein
MIQIPASSHINPILHLLETFDGRDELISCLDFVGHAHDENSALLNSLTLASLPTWLEENGYRTDLLGRFFQDVDLATATSSPPETLFDIVASLGQDTTALQLVDAVAKRSPIAFAALLEAIEEVHETFQELGSVAGGANKSEAVTKDVLAGVGALTLIGGTGYGIYIGGRKLISHIRIRSQEAAERAAERERQAVQEEKENLYDDISQYLVSGKISRDDAKTLGERLKNSQFPDGNVTNLEPFKIPREVLEKKLLDSLYRVTNTVEDQRLRELLERSGVQSDLAQGKYILNKEGNEIVDVAKGKLGGEMWSQLSAYSLNHLTPYLNSSQFTEAVRQLVESVIKDIESKAIKDVNTELKREVVDELSNAEAQVEVDLRPIDDIL